MDLLRQIRESAVDPDYAAVGKHVSRDRLRVPLLVVALVLGAVVAVQGWYTYKASPDAASERQQLISRIRAADTTNDGLRAQQLALEQEIAQLQRNQADTGSQAQLDAQGAVSGSTAVTGPGMVVVVDDAAGANGARVTDEDLRQLVNGAWQAGAEAIAINGHRLTTRTAIRSAGSAITVDYRSLLRPYRVEVIGDPKTMPARFAGTQGGAWWADAKNSYGLGYDMSTSSSLTLPADPGLTVTTAQKS
ncbi:MAG TPA: DUF881 domain-containing protein [Propionibacteriaceae bacterium]|nr:DUF881 domain-containing protein [Propionibacteriaceae bacterium]